MYVHETWDRNRKKHESVNYILEIWENLSKENLVGGLYKDLCSKLKLFNNMDNIYIEEPLYNQSWHYKLRRPF